MTRTRLTNRSIERVLLTALLAGLLAAFGQSQSPRVRAQTAQAGSVAILADSRVTLDAVRRENLAPGIDHVEVVRTGEAETDRWVINIVEADPRVARLRSALAMDQIVGLETTSSLAQRYDAMVAINGSYFRTTGIIRGEPAGVFALNGKVLSESLKNRAALALSNGPAGIRVAITRVTTTASLRSTHGRRTINGINRLASPGELILFTPEFHRTTLTPSEGVEMLVADRRVKSIVLAGSHTIPSNGSVFLGMNQSAVWLRQNFRVGSLVRMVEKTVCDPPLSFSPHSLVGGGPRLVASGKEVWSEDLDAYSASLIKLRHPRTALGVREDGHILLVTVDGRQAGVSIGLTIAELTNLMLELKCVEAINLDGGGSTTMVIRDKVINHPSDPAGERPVGDALLLYARPF